MFGISQDELRPILRVQSPPEPPKDESFVQGQVDPDPDSSMWKKYEDETEEAGQEEGKKGLEIEGAQDREGEGGQAVESGQGATGGRMFQFFNPSDSTMASTSWSLPEPNKKSEKTKREDEFGNQNWLFGEDWDADANVPEQPDLGPSTSTWQAPQELQPQEQPEDVDEQTSGLGQADQPDEEEGEQGPNEEEGRPSPNEAKEGQPSPQEEYEGNATMEEGEGEAGESEDKSSEVGEDEYFPAELENSFAPHPPTSPSKKMKVQQEAETGMSGSELQAVEYSVEELRGSGEVHLVFVGDPEQGPIEVDAIALTKSGNGETNYCTMSADYQEGEKKEEEEEKGDAGAGGEGGEGGQEGAGGSDEADEDDDDDGAHGVDPAESTGEP